MSSLDLAVRILEQVPLPVWVVDGDGAVAFANDAAAAALGYGDPLALRGRPGHDTVHHHHPDGAVYPAAECPLLQPGQTGEPAAADDQWFIRRDGSLFPITWTAAPIELPGGRGTVLSFQDATTRRARTEAVRALEWAEIRAGHPRPVDLADRETLVETIMTFAARNATDPALTPDVLAREHHISLRMLQSLFAETGVSPARFIREQRLAHARRLLLEGLPVALAAGRSGFAGAGTFTRAFRRRFGMTPSRFVEAV
jgi:PAS domain S-box-containing protein